MIETARLLLRPPQPRDRDALCRMFADPQVMADLGAVKDGAATDIVLARHDQDRAEGLGFLVIERRHDGAMLGFCGLKRGDAQNPISGEIEAGWIIDRPYWRQGYAYEATAAILSWGWRNTAADRIVAIASRGECEEPANDGPARDDAPRRRRLRPCADHFRGSSEIDGDVRDRAPAVIETERLWLRRWRDSDAEPFHAMGQDDEVMRFLGPSMTRREARASIARQNAEVDAHGTCFWAVERRADGAFLGFCGVKPAPEGTPIEGQPEIGWRLARTAWGHGYAREGAQACLADAWARGEDEVFAITVPNNVRSWGLMIRLGMTRLAGGDFNHPALPLGDPLSRHITYRIARP